MQWLYDPVRGHLKISPQGGTTWTGAEATVTAPAMQRYCVYTSLCIPMPRIGGHCSRILSLTRFKYYPCEVPTATGLKACMASTNHDGRQKNAELMPISKYALIAVTH